MRIVEDQQVPDQLDKSILINILWMQQKDKSILLITNVQSWGIEQVSKEVQVVLVWNHMCDWVYLEVCA